MLRNVKVGQLRKVKSTLKDLDFILHLPEAYDCYWKHHSASVFVALDRNELFIIIGFNNSDSIIHSSYCGSEFLKTAWIKKYTDVL